MKLISKLLGLSIFAFVSQTMAAPMPNTITVEDKAVVPIVQKGSVIVPTSKVEVKSTLSQGGVVLAEGKQVDAQGVEFKKGQEPVRKELKLDQVKDPNSKESVTRAVLQENGTTTKDVVVVKEPE